MATKKAAHRNSRILIVLMLTVFTISAAASQSHADQSIPVEAGNIVHAYPFLASNQGLSKSSNTVFAQVYAYGFNPQDNGDPNYDYYLLDVQAVATPVSGWSIDSGGLADAHNATLIVDLSLQSCSSGTFVSGQVNPSTTLVPQSPNSPVTVQVSVPVSGANAQISDTFTPGASEAQATKIQQCLVEWKAGYCSIQTSGLCLGGQQIGSAFYYHFVTTVAILRGQTFHPLVTAFGSFYVCAYLISCSFEQATTTINNSFLMPPVSKIVSNPPVPNSIQVDNIPIGTAASYVWNVGDIHTITATPLVPGSPGVQYSFISWSDSGVLSHEIIGPVVPTTFQANYQTQFQFTISSPSNGLTDPPPSSLWENQGSSVSVRAVPNSGYEMDHWILDGVNAGSSNPILVPMSQPHTLLADFKLEPVLTVSASVGGSVSILSSSINNNAPEIVTSGSSRSFPVPDQTSVTLTATPSSPYVFGNWTGSQFYSNNPLTIVVGSNIQENANFRVIRENVTFSILGIPSTVSGIVLTVDGSPYPVGSLPISFSWIVGSNHTFSWASSLLSGQTPQYIWQASNGFSTAESGTIVVPSNGGTIIGSYQVTQSSSTTKEAAPAVQATTTQSTGNVNIPRVSSTSTSSSSNSQGTSNNTSGGSTAPVDNTIVISSTLGVSIIIAAVVVGFFLRRRA